MTTNPSPPADLPEALTRQVFIYVMLGSVGFLAGIGIVMFLIPAGG
jgi:hypothetical protein